MEEETPQSSYKYDIDKISLNMSNFKIEVENALKELDLKGEKWFSLDTKKQKLAETLNFEETEVIINVGGKKFYTCLNTLLETNNNIFYNLILTDQIDFKQEIFIDRSHQFFNHILSYLRNKDINLDGEDYLNLKKIYEESIFYEITGLEDKISQLLQIPRLVSFEHNGPYRSGVEAIGKNNIKYLRDYNDKSGRNGITCASPGWIIFELDRILEPQIVEIMGYRGNSKFNSSNGQNSKILISSNKNNWTEIGIIPSTFNNDIVKVTVKSKGVSGKYIKLQSTGYLGVGYFKVIGKSDD